MKVKLNGTKYKIKTSSLLTVREHIEFFEREHQDLITYLSIITGLGFAEVQKCKISDRTINQLSAYIQKVYPFEHFWNLKKPQTGIIFHDIFHELDSLDWNTLGVRHALEQKQEKENNITKLAIYTLAVMLSIDNDYDNDVTEMIYNELLDMPYPHVLHCSAFFFRKLQNGRKKDRKSFKWLRKVLRISTVTS